MLLFILKNFSNSPFCCYFNTSHVTVYRLQIMQPLFIKKYFNTSHVTVYQEDNCWRNQLRRYFNTSHVTVYQTVFTEFGQHITFQYISCYCLSRYLLPDLVPHCYFNTSHVTVYRCAAISLTFLQYHFNTSHVTVYRVQELCLHERSGISIHLMLLFILASRPIRIVLMDFNTSHVTVYPLHRTCEVPIVQISIHLMLLFIKYSHPYRN